MSAQKRIRARFVSAFVLAAAVALASLLAGCSKQEPKPVAAKPVLEGAEIVFPKDSVQLASISSEPARASSRHVIRLNGRLVWNEERTVRLYPAFAGRVTRIHVAPGDRVAPGQTLALLASPDFGLAQAEARKAVTEFALAEKNLARLRQLVANGVAPQKELNAAEADHARAEVELARTRERLKLYGGGDAIDQSFSLKSPIAGVVVERNINPGQELRPDLAAANAPAMFIVTDPTKLWVQLDATERDLAEIKVGRDIVLEVGAYPGEQFKARIDAIADFIDPATRMIRIRGGIDNRDKRLKGEMFVRASVEGEQRAAIEVPTRGVFLEGAHHYLFVTAAHGRYQRVKVQVAGESGGWTEVLDGVAVGQRIVVEGSLLLQRLFQQLQKH